MGAMLDSPWDGQSFSPPTAIDIATLESAIVAQLQSQIDQIEIAHYPDQPESYRLVHRVGAALVQYHGARYGDMLDTAAIIQTRLLEFAITILMRDLGWSYGGDPGGTSPGAYAMLEAVRAALTGFRIPGCRKMYPLGERFVERDSQGGVWIYQITFALSTLAVETAPVANFPSFVTGIAMEEGGQTTVAAGSASYTFDSSGQIHLPAGNVSDLSVIASGNQMLKPGIDYSVDPVAGVITALPGGAAAAGQTVEITYSYADQVIAAAGESSPAN